MKVRVKKRESVAQKYESLLAIAAAEGSDAVDDSDLATALKLLDKSLDDFEADVQRLHERAEAVERLKVADAMADEIAGTDREIKRLAKEMERLRSEFEAQVGPLEREHAESREQLRDELENQRLERTEAIRFLIKSAAPVLHERLNDLQRERTGVLDDLERSKSELAYAEPRSKKLAFLRSSFQRWKAGMPTGLQRDTYGLVKLPAWAADDASYEWAQLPDRSDPAVVAQCEARLERIESRANTVGKVRDKQSQLRRRLAELDEAIEETQKDMLK